MADCTKCGESGAYVGFLREECLNPDCESFSREWLREAIERMKRETPPADLRREDTEPAARPRPRCATCGSGAVVPQPTTAGYDCDDCGAETSYIDAMSGKLLPSAGMPTPADRDGWPVYLVGDSHLDFGPVDHDELEYLPFADTYGDYSPVLIDPADADAQMVSRRGDSDPKASRSSCGQGDARQSGSTPEEARWWDVHLPGGHAQYSWATFAGVQAEYPTLRLTRVREGYAVAEQPQSRSCSDCTTGHPTDARPQEPLGLEAQAIDLATIVGELQSWVESATLWGSNPLTPERLHAKLRGLLDRLERTLPTPRR
jgi:hypothetical protein